MRKPLALLLSLVLAVGLLAACTKPKTETPPHQATGTTVTIHYYRYNGDYEPWDLWVWPMGKEGKGYKFDQKDDFGVYVTIQLAEPTEKVGFIIRKGGDSWSGKDVGKDRFIEIKNGKAEIWVVEGEENFAADKSQVSTDPKIRTAYLDSKRTVTVSTSHAIELKGGTEGFAFSPPLKIDSVKDARVSETGLIGYEFTSQGKEIRFVLEPGRLGLSKGDDGKSTIFISGGFNDWSQTAKGKPFTGDPAWQMKWNAAANRYELTAPVGTGAGQVPPSGAEFKFTIDKSGGQEWLPSQNITIKAGSAIGTGTTELLITLAEDADVTRDYVLEHASLIKAPVLKRGVLNDAAFVYEGSDMGATYSASGTRFRLWAPTVTAADVLIYDKPEGGSAKESAMKQDKGGTWVTEVAGDLNGKYYTYRITTGGNKSEVVDPYAIGAAVNGNRALIVDLDSTDPAGWSAVKRPAFGNITDAVIYEMHVRDFSTHESSGIKTKGKFLAFTELGTTGPGGVKTGVEHLKELGITHVHLLPPFDYASVDENKPDQFNWGYDPKNFNVPEGSYATNPNGPTRIREFKEMVKALHENGIRVVMDVVYNHTSMGASPFEAIAPTYYYRYDVTGKLSNGSGTGNETASERPMMRKYIVDSVRFWAEEYQVDGFRFDLMGLHDLETVKQVRAALDAIDPSIIVYGEPWTGGSTPLDQSLRIGKGNQKGLGVAVFNDNIRNGIKGDNDGIMKGFATGAGSQQANIQRGVVGGIDFSQWVKDFTLEPTESINYVSSHDNLTLWDKISKSNADDSEENRIKMDLLSQAIVFTSQGVPFMQGGEELLRTKGGNHNSYNAPDSVNQFDYGRKAKYPQVFSYYQGLIALRKAHPAFRMTRADQVREHLTFIEKGIPNNTVVFQISGNANGDSWKNIFVVYNPNREDVSVNLPPGPWEMAAQGLKVGTGSLGTASGSAKVPPISMMVLYQK